MLNDTVTDFTRPESFDLTLVVEERLELEDSVVFTRPDSTAWFLHQTFGSRERELFGVLLLDAEDRLTGYHLVQTGTRRRVTVEAYSVFAPALLANAHAVIIWHNHPSVAPRGA